MVYDGPRNVYEPRIRLPSYHPVGHQGERVTMVPPMYTYSTNTKVTGTYIKLLRSHTSSTKSLRRARNRRGKFTSCEKPWSSCYDVRGTIGASLCHAKNLGQVVTTCEEPLGRVTSCEKHWSSRYNVQGTLIGSGLQRAEEP